MALDKLDPHKIESIVKQALVEDIGKGDITTQLTIPKDKLIKGTVLANEDCVVCGLDIMETAFKTVDKNIKFSPQVKEGHKVKKGKAIALVEGKAQNILSAERVGLNLLSLLSSVATKTREYVDRIEPSKVKISDTRKTIPGLRDLQKYAVRVGGGHNHRMSLDEMVLIKDNHIKVTEGYSKLPIVPKGFKIEVEVQNLEEFKHALKFKPDFIMLDNMDIADMKKAVEILNNTLFNSHHPRTKLEASGGVTLDNIKEIALTGVDIISIGDITHSIKSVDISLEVE